MAKIFFPLDNRGFGYYTNFSNAGINDKDVFLYYGIKNKLLNKLYQVHNKWEFNKRHELPMKYFWFNACLSNIPDVGEEDIFFVFLEVFMLAYSKSFIKTIKMKYKNPHFVFYFINPINDDIWNKFLTIKDEYDLVSTFNRKDSIQYNIGFFPDFPYKINIVNPSKDFPTSDVFFVGASKGRLRRLIDIYEKLSQNNIRCDFHITGVPKEEQIYSDCISYNHIISYDEVLQRVANTKCVLEVLQEGCNYFSIRTIEAFQNKKKLLTTNAEIITTSYYNPEVVQVINQNNDIDIGFITKEVLDSQFVDLVRNTTFSSLKNYLTSNV